LRLTQRFVRTHSNDSRMLDWSNIVILCHSAFAMRVMRVRYHSYDESVANW